MSDFIGRCTWLLQALPCCDLFRCHSRLHTGAVCTIIDECTHLVSLSNECTWGKRNNDDNLVPLPCTIATSARNSWRKKKEFLVNFSFIIGSVTQSPWNWTDTARVTAANWLWEKIETNKKNKMQLKEIYVQKIIRLMILIKKVLLI